MFWQVLGFLRSQFSRSDSDVNRRNSNRGAAPLKHYDVWGSGDANKLATKSVRGPSYPPAQPSNPKVVPSDPPAGTIKSASCGAVENACYGVENELQTMSSETLNQERHREVGGHFNMKKHVKYQFAMDQDIGDIYNIFIYIYKACLHGLLQQRHIHACQINISTSAVRAHVIKRVQFMHMSRNVVSSATFFCMNYSAPHACFVNCCRKFNVSRVGSLYCCDVNQEGNGQTAMC